MPLIDVTVKPGYVFPEDQKHYAAPATAMYFVRRNFAPDLPALFMANKSKFGLDATTPQEGVQVQIHTYDEFDVNVADLWVKVQLTEAPPRKAARLAICKAMHDALVALLHEFGYEVPNNFMLDVFWGPGHGCGTIDGTYTQW